jgi:dihydroneopterin aldolase
VTDRIVLANMTFQARHGVHDWEKRNPQRFEVDVELELDLGPAGRTDNLGQTIDYGPLYDQIAAIVNGRPVDLIETLAQAVADAILGSDLRIEAVTVRVRKPEVRLGGPLDHAAVEIMRRR